MKVPRTKSLMTLIYMSLLALPLCAILGRTAYTIVNKNAYQSYSGAKESEYLDFNVDDNDDLQNGTRYYFHMKTFTINTSLQESQNYYIATEVWNGNDYYTDMRLGIYADANNVPYIFARRLSNLDSVVFSIRFDNSVITELSFIYDYDNFTSQVAKDYPNLYFKGANPSYTLDNAFDYSVSEVVKEGNIGKLDFFTWFTDFLLNDNAKNNLYVHFANWYLNYAMVISLMQILFLCLMWFVNFSRRLLERGMNYDW